MPSRKQNVRAYEERAPLYNPYATPIDIPLPNIVTIGTLMFNHDMLRGAVFIFCHDGLFRDLT